MKMYLFIGSLLSESKSKRLQQNSRGFRSELIGMQIESGQISSHTGHCLLPGLMRERVASCGGKGGGQNQVPAGLI